MNLNTENQKRVINVYKKLYQYKHLLTDIRPFPVNEEEQLIPQIDAVHNQVRLVMGYLLDVNPESLETKQMIRLVESKYEPTTFWFQVVVDYIEVLNEIEKVEADAVLQKRKEPLVQSKAEIDKIINIRRNLIKKYSAPIKEKGFLVNAEELIKNYLNYADDNPEKAWEVLTTNPAYFSSINVFDKSGKRILSPASAQKMNVDLGQFIKDLKVELTIE